MMLSGGRDWGNSISAAFEHPILLLPCLFQLEIRYAIRGKPNDPDRFDIDIFLEWLDRHFFKFLGGGCHGRAYFVHFRSELLLQFFDVFLKALDLVFGVVDILTLFPCPSHAGHRCR